MTSMSSLRGQLLVAAPTLLDPNFRRTVVLIGEHTEEGAMGVVLNRPTEATVGEAVPGLQALIDSGEPVFRGGPVAPTGVVILAELDDPSRAGVLVAPGVGFLASEADIVDPSAGIGRARAFAGHAGWGSGQLDAEVEADGWIVVPHEREDLFSEAPERLWTDVLERQGGRYALLARMPLDPSMN